MFSNSIRQMYYYHILGMMYLVPAYKKEGTKNAGVTYCATAALFLKC